MFRCQLLHIKLQIQMRNSSRKAQCHVNEKCNRSCEDITANAVVPECVLAETRLELQDGKAIKALGADLFDEVVRELDRQKD